LDAIEEVSTMTSAMGVPGLIREIAADRAHDDLAE